MEKWTLLFFIFFNQIQAATWTWSDVVERAKKENMTLRVAREQLVSAQYLQNAALKGFLPSLRANVSISRSGSEQPSSIISNGQVINVSSSVINDNVVTSLNLNQNIFSGLRDLSRFNQARWQNQNKFWTLERTKSDVSYNLKEAYSNLLYAQEYLSLTKNIISRRQSNLQIVEVRYKSGRENKGSVLLAEAYFEQAKLDELIAKNTLEVARKQLFSLINKDAFDEYQVSGEPPLISLEIDDSKLKDLVTDTPDYHQAFSLEKASSYEVGMARSAFMPTLDFSASLARSNNYFFPDDQTERWTLGLNLSIPIFDGLSDYSIAKSAVANRYAAKATKRNTYLNLIPIIKTSYNQAKQSDVKLRVDSRFREASLTRAEIARAKYNNGLLTFEDWDIIESELISRQISYLQSKRDRIVKYAALERSLGKGSL